MIFIYNQTREKNMNFLEKLGKVLLKNIAYTIVLIVALICFFYFSRDLIAGLFTVISALIIYMCVENLYHAYQNMPSGGARKSTAKKTAKKK